MTKGVLGPDGWVVPEREKPTLGTVEESTRENIRLVERCNGLQTELEDGAKRELALLKKIKYLEDVQKPVTKPAVKKGGSRKGGAKK